MHKPGASCSTTMLFFCVPSDLFFVAPPPPLDTLAGKDDFMVGSLVCLCRLRAVELKEEERREKRMEERDKLAWCLSFLLSVCTYVPAACLCSDGQASSVVEHMQTTAEQRAEGGALMTWKQQCKAHTTPGKDM